MGEAASERAKAAQMKQPLKVEIYGGELSITIGLDTLAYAIQQGFHWEPDRFKISDPEEFAKDVLRQLEREDESGSTVVHRMLDAAACEARDQGSEHVTEAEPVAEAPPDGAASDVRADK